MTIEQVARELQGHVRDGELAGRDTIDALQTLLHIEVAQAFRRLCDAFERGDIEADELDELVVDKAHELRVAIAVRHGRAGATKRERALAQDVDRRLNPLRAAVGWVDDDLDEWLWDRYVDGAELDFGTWWAYQADPRYQENKEAVDETLQSMALHAAFAEPEPDPHEASWAEDAGWGAYYYWCEYWETRWEPLYELAYDLDVAEEEAWERWWSWCQAPPRS